MNPNVAVHYESVRKAALDAFLASEEGRKYQPMFKDSEAKSANFKGPEGFSNVVGVGANPVIEAMNAQLEATQETNAILREIANGGGASTDFTKANSSPSRASLLIR